MSDRFPPSASAVEACKEVVSSWRDVHCPGQNLDEQIHMLASRVNSWVSGASVVAGVRDVMSSVITQGEDKQAIIDELGTRLGRRLSDDGLLLASPRRSASLG
jgi:hypothetical protein